MKSPTVNVTTNGITLFITPMVFIFNYSLLFNDTNYRRGRSRTLGDNRMYLVYTLTALFEKLFWLRIKTSYNLLLLP